MILRLYFIVLTAAALTAATNTQAKEAAISDLTYESFVDLVVAQHPVKAIDEKRVSKAKESEARSGLLPDPQLSMSRTDVPLPNRFQKEPIESIEREGAEWQMSLSQSFPWPGTLAAEERAARARTTTAENEANLSATRRRFEAKELFLRLVRLARTIDVQKGNLKVIENTRDFAREKFKQGIGSHMEFLQAQSESGIMRTNLTALETDLLNLKRHALLLIGSVDFIKANSVHFVLEWPKGEGGPTPALKANEGPSDNVRNLILIRKDAVRAQQDAEYSRTLPSFMASGMLMREDSGMKMYAGMLGISLPIYSSVTRHSLSSEESIVEAEAAQAIEWHDKRKALALIQAESRIHQIEANLNLLRYEIIPPLKQHLESEVVLFSQGKTNIASIIQGQRSLIDLSMTEVATRESLTMARLALEKVQAGFVDEAIDLEVPQVPGIGMRGMGMGGGMESTSTKMKSQPMKNAVPSPSPIPEEEEPSESTPKGTMQGM